METQKRDRFTLAWELRRDIHAYLLAEPHSIMLEIFDAFPERKQETVRKAVIRMRHDGDVAMIGSRGKEGRYLAISQAVRPESDKRRKLSSGARKSQPIAAAACRVHLTKKEQRKAAAEARRQARIAAKAATDDERKPAKWEGWTERGTVHKCGDTRPATDSRGQGCARSRVHVNCYQLF